MPIIIKCPICGTERKRPKTSTHFACSYQCGAKLRYKNICDKFPKDEFYKLYVVQQKGFREIEQLKGFCVKTLRKMAVTYDIPVRHGSEAIRTQWINAEDRKNAHIKLMREFRTTHGMTKEYNKLMNSGGHGKWRNEVKQRDGFKCVKCGETKNIHAHHLIAVMDRPDLRLDVSNGITVCRQCHMSIHSQLQKGVAQQKGVVPPPTLH